MIYKYFTWFLGVIILLSIIYSVVNHEKRNDELKKSTLVIATIKSIEDTRGAFNVTVEYEYNGKALSGVFGIYNTDSLKVNEKIRISISKKFPDKYIKYIGVAL